MELENRSSILQLVFYPVSESIKLDDHTRALVKTDKGCIEMAIYFENGGWSDEGSEIYAGGISGHLNVVEFALIPEPWT